MATKIDVHWSNKVKVVRTHFPADNTMEFWTTDLIIEDTDGVELRIQMFSETSTAVIEDKGVDDAFPS